MNSIENYTDPQKRHIIIIRSESVPRIAARKEKTAEKRKKLVHQNFRFMHTQVEHVWSFDEMIGQIGSDIAFSKPREHNCCNIKKIHIYSLLSGFCVWHSSALIIIGLLLLFSANYLLQILLFRATSSDGRERERTAEVLWTLNSNGWRSFNHRLPSLISLGLSESWVFWEILL